MSLLPGTKSARTCFYLAYAGFPGPWSSPGAGTTCASSRSKSWEGRRLNTTVLGAMKCGNRARQNSMSSAVALAPSLMILVADLCADYGTPVRTCGIWFLQMTWYSLGRRAQFHFYPSCVQLNFLWQCFFPVLISCVAVKFIFRLSMVCNWTFIRLLHVIHVKDTDPAPRPQCRRRQHDSIGGLHFFLFFFFFCNRSTHMHLTTTNRSTAFNKS